LDTLENYLASDYLAERQEIVAIDRMLSNVAATFSAPEIFDRTGWPYEFRTSSGEASLSSSVSQGTLAMVLTATGRMLGHCKLLNGTFAALVIEDRKGLEVNWRKGLDLLLVALKSGKTFKVFSTTFGKNNPLTLSHLSELYIHLKQSEFEDKRAMLAKRIAAAKKELRTVLRKDLATQTLLKLQNNRDRYYSNAFVPLRALRAGSDLAIGKSKVDHRLFFESTLHEQLSFSTIPDSRFDPAELVFCLEGLLLCAPEAVDATLFNRVLQVLAEKQNTSAHWRPNKPFVASSTGSIMLPVSVEGANSLMRSTIMMDRNRAYDTFTAKSLPLIQRFWHWLRARSVRFDLGKRHCVGWHSEHVNVPSLIHIWDTSQVAEFLIAFREMLERHIATKSLQLSRLDTKRLRLQKEDSARNVKARWKTKIDTFEPMLGAAKVDQVYYMLENDFVVPWNSGNPNFYSILLYGPPGTGKSTVAENLAEVLDLPLITVTVSDFLGAGGANVEARAKAIFQTLEAQERCVILFDEIDSFLLDRNTRLYREQDSLFQFLTPGMLTKIADLRKTKRSIFIIATNYADRIDPAIKRTGRIDKQYLLPLPNAKRRLKIMESFGLKVPPHSKTLERATAFFGYSDLKGATHDAGGKSATVATVLESLARSEPSTSFDTYLSRLNLAETEKFPTREFLGLVEIAKEVGKDLGLKSSIDKARHDPKKESLLETYDLLRFGS
jgi:hypothetical protein